MTNIKRLKVQRNDIVPRSNNQPRALNVIGKVARVLRVGNGPRSLVLQDDVVVTFICVVGGTCSGDIINCK